MKTKKFTILHSNDMHGDFLAEAKARSGKSKVVTTSAQQVLEEFFKNNQNITRKIEGRLIYL